MTDIINNLKNKELQHARNLALQGIHAGLSHLGLTTTYEKDFLEGVVFNNIPVSTTFNTAALKIVENKISIVSAEDGGETTDSLQDKITACDGDKDKLEAMAIWLYDINLNKRKSFDNMVEELKEHIENK